MSDLLFHAGQSERVSLLDDQAHPTSLALLNLKDLLAASLDDNLSARGRNGALAHALDLDDLAAFTLVASFAPEITPFRFESADLVFDVAFAALGLAVDHQSKRTDVDGVGVFLDIFASDSSFDNRFVVALK